MNFATSVAGDFTQPLSSQNGVMVGWYLDVDSLLEEAGCPHWESLNARLGFFASNESQMHQNSKQFGQPVRKFKSEQ